MSYQITGLRELISNLARKEQDIIRAARAANLAGGKVILEELKRNIPTSGYSGPNPKDTLLSAATMRGNRGYKAKLVSYVSVGFIRYTKFMSLSKEFTLITQSSVCYRDSN